MVPHQSQMCLRVSHDVPAGTFPRKGAHLERVIRHDRNMRIEGKPGEPLSTVYLWLTPDEARELRDTIDQMVRGDDSGWHGHVSSAEVTVALDRA